MSSRRKCPAPAFGGEVQIVDFTATVHRGAIEPSRTNEDTVRRGSVSQRGANPMQIYGFRGEWIAVDDAEYDTTRAVWNNAVDRRPRLIARCSGAADAAAAVCYARDHDLEIAVRGGGHNVAGTAVCDNGMVVDLSSMRAVWVDAGS